MGNANVDWMTAWEEILDRLQFGREPRDPGQSRFDPLLPVAL
jgi:hypothetical protein